MYLTWDARINNYHITIYKIVLLDFIPMQEYKNIQN